MLCSKYWSLLTLSCLISFKSTTVYGLIDPITGTLAVGAFIIGYFVPKSTYRIPFFSSSCPKTFNFNSRFNVNYCATNIFVECQQEIKSYDLFVYDYDLFVFHSFHRNVFIFCVLILT